MDKAPKKKVVRGKRYSAEEKGKVVAFVTEHNAKNGRGGQSAAADKFKISQITIAAWLKKSGVKSTRKAKATKAGKAVKATKATKGAKVTKDSPVTGGIQKKLSAMISLGQEIEKLERELSAKRAKFHSLKISL
jgi:transposase-like protein